jgi:hypothetical protein
MSKQWTEKQLRIAAGQVWDRETGSFSEGPADDREKWIEWVIRPYQISVSMCWKSGSNSHRVSTLRNSGRWQLGVYWPATDAK